MDAQKIFGHGEGHEEAGGGGEAFDDRFGDELKENASAKGSQSCVEK